MSNLVIATNVQSLNSHRALKITAQRGEKASEKLSSGFRINKAGDDASGLAISEKMRNQIKGLNMASKNAADGISLLQTAEGALQEVHEMLKRMRELVIQGANDTNVTGDRAKIITELNQLICEIDETASRTEFNTKRLIDGNLDRGYALTGTPTNTDVFLQVGANANQNLQFSLKAMSFNALINQGLPPGVIYSLDAMSPFTVGRASKQHFQSVSPQLVQARQGGGMDPNDPTRGSGAHWSAMRASLDHAISNVSSQRAMIGALTNRLEHTIRNIDVTSENLSAAESRIRDTDMAKEMMEFTKTNILSQAGMSMLAQANQAPNNVLSIIR